MALGESQVGEKTRAQLLLQYRGPSTKIRFEKKEYVHTRGSCGKNKSKKGDEMRREHKRIKNLT